METDVIRETLSAAKTGWYRYFGTLGLINIILLIDLITGMRFLSASASESEVIKILGLDLPRIAFSLIYSLLFFAFVVWAAISSKIICRIVFSYTGNIFNIPEYHLWLLSPISQFKFIRIMFWLIAVDGLIILASVTFIHLFRVLPPSSEIMSASVYVGIGWFCCLVFLVTVGVSTFYIFPKWKKIHSKLRQNANKSSKRGAVTSAPLEAL